MRAPRKPALLGPRTHSRPAGGGGPTRAGRLLLRPPYVAEIRCSREGGGAPSWAARCNAMERTDGRWARSADFARIIDSGRLLVAAAPPPPPPPQRGVSNNPPPSSSLHRARIGNEELRPPRSSSLICKLAGSKAPLEPLGSRSWRNLRASERQRTQLEAAEAAQVEVAAAAARTMRTSLRPPGQLGSLALHLCISAFVAFLAPTAAR